MLIVVLTICLTLYGVWSMRNIPLDAIPDLSDPQVIIYTEWPGRSPDLIEDQITYPIISAMLAAPHVSVVRGSSDYGFSYVYVMFDEGHRHLLGPNASARIHEQDQRATS